MISLSRKVGTWVGMRKKEPLWYYWYSKILEFLIKTIHNQFNKATDKLMNKICKINKESYFCSTVTRMWLYI